MSPLKTHVARSGLAWLAITLVACALPLVQRGASGLAGREFLLQSAEGAPVVSGATVWLGFTRSALSVHAGCNHLSTDYSLEGPRLIARGMLQTEMGCEALDQKRDEWLSKLLTSRPLIDVSGATLTLTQGDTRLVFVDRVLADPDRPLVETTWEVGSYIEGGTAMGFMEIADPNLTFSSDGTWSLRATCTTGGGRYQKTGTQLTLSAANFIDTPCLDASEREAASFVKSVVIGGPLSYDIKAHTLTLKGKARSLQLHARK